MTQLVRNGAAAAAQRGRGGLRTAALTALLLVSSLAAWAGRGIFQSYAIVNAAGATTYKAGGANADAAASFAGFNYGTFAAGGVLTLGGEQKTFKNSGDNITAGTLFYRVYQTGGTPGSFLSINLPFSDDNLGGTVGNQKWTNVANTTGNVSSPVVNLLAGLTARGNYTVEVFWSASSPQGDVFDSNGGANYKAFFDYSSGNLCGTAYTINSGAAATANNFVSFTSAFAALNAVGVGCAVAFNVASGSTYTESNMVLNAVTGASAANTITFVKAGATANPKITAGTTAVSTTLDAIISLSGADFVTFNGIDLSENAANTTTATQMEFGFALFRPTPTDGCQNNTIRNCVVTLNKTNVNTIGIYGAVSAATVATSVAATSPAGANSGNKIFGCVITNAVQGIYLTGNTSTLAANFDLNNEIGVLGANTVGNFGGLGVSGWGIGVNAQNGAKIANNIINSTLNYTSATASTAVLASTVTSTLRGVYGNAGASSNIDITNNTVTLASGATTSQLLGIDNGIGSTAAGNTVNITGNTVTNCTYATATTGVFFGILNSASAATVNVSANTVTNNTTVGTGAMTLVSGGSPTTLNLNSNIISNNSKQAATTTASITLSSLVAGTAAVTATGNTITNNSIVTSGVSTSTGTVFGYSQGSSPTAETLTGNTITGLSVSGTSTSAASIVTGIRTFPLATTVQLFTLNTVGSLSISAGSGTVSGMTLSSGGGTGTSISRNKVYDLSAGGTGGVANGISISGGTTYLVSNNLIGDLRAPAATGLLAIAGLNLSSGTQVNAYFNTIYLNATGGATFGTSGILFGSTSPILDLRNNVVVNTSTGSGAASFGFTAALRRSGGTAGTVPTNYATTANNNLFWAGVPSAANLIYVEGSATPTNAQQTLAAHKAFMANRDQASVTENPPFLSTTGTLATFLHLSTTVATQAESGGAAIAGLPTDFDGDTRNATTPDIGADEGTFVPSDLSAPVISYAALGNTGGTGNRPLATTITDASGLATGTKAPLVYFKKNAGAYFSAVATSIAGSSYTFTINAATLGGLVAGDVVSYYVAAQDASANNNVGTSPGGGGGINPPGTTAPATPNSYTIVGTLAGDYYVLGTAAAGTSPGGATREYPTLSAAAADYNSKGLTGAVRFLLFSNTQGTETYPITFNANADASAVNTLTIKPSPGVTTTFANATTTSTFRTLSATNVVIDGSNAAGGTTRDLTLSNTSATATAAALVWVASTLAAPANNVQVRNLNLLGAANAGTTTSAGVMVSNTTYNLSTGGSANGVVISNNSVQGTSLGIVVGNDPTAPGTGLQITNNLLGPAVAATASNLGAVGLFVQQATAPVITGNTVRNVVGAGTGGAFPVGTSPTGAAFPAGVTGASFSQNTISGVTATGGADAYGLFVGAGFTGGTVSRNQVLSVTGGPGGYSGHGIDVNNLGSTAANLTLSNNFVGGIGGTGWITLTSASNAGVTGIRIYNGTQGGINLYHNSVSLTGATSSTSATALSAAVYVGSGTTALNVRNNVFANALVSAAATAKAYAFNSASANTAFTAINFNDYFVSGTQGVLGAINAADAATLAAFQAASGQDANSISVDPAFTSATDLHTANTALAVGTPIAGLTVDIDGETRSATTPYLGADEVPALNVDAQPTALLAPAGSNPCYSSAETVTVTVRNASTLAALNFVANPVTVTVAVTGAATQTFVATVNTNAGNPGGTALAIGGSVNITLPGTLNMSAAGTYNFAVSASASGDQNTANDNLSPSPTRTVTAPALTGVSASPNTICGASGTVTLTATGVAGGTVRFFSSADGFAAPIGTGSPLTLTGVSATTSYRANVTCGANTSANSAAVTVTVNNPSVTGTTGAGTYCQGSTASLTAAGSSGTTVRLFAAATGGTALATGTAGAGTISYTTPALATTGTTNYFAEAFTGLTETTGMPAPNAADGSTLFTNTGVLFTVANGPQTLVATTIYPVGTGTVNVALYDNAGVQVIIGGVAQETGNVSVAGTGVSTPVVVPLNFANIPAGSNYRLLLKASSGITGLVRGTASASNYATPSGSVTTVNGSLTPPTVSTAYYFFYNLTFTNACASARTGIALTVTPAPALTVTPATPQAICAGAGLNVTASGAGYTSYAYSPGTGVTLTSANGATATLAPTTTTTYTITATTAGPGGCVTSQAYTVNVNPTPNAPTLTPSAPAAYCAGGSTVVGASSNPLTLTNQTILATATFDGGANGFAVTTGTGNTAGAQFLLATAPYTNSYSGGPTAYNGPSGAGTGGFYVANSGTSSTTTANTQLVSPTFSTVGYTTATLGFQQYYKYFTSTADVVGRVEYSVDGTNWVTLADYRALATSDGTATGAQTAKALALPAAALGQASVQVRFNYNSTFGYYYAIDNVGVTGSRTEAPTYAVAGSPATASVLGSNITFNPTTTTTYGVTATYPSSPGCPSPATSVTITVNPRPTATLAASGPVCSGSATTLSGTLTGSGPWSLSYTANGGPATTVTGLASPFSIVPAAITAGTTYAITALSDANGCAATSFPASVAVTVSPRPTASLSNNGPVCGGTAATVSVALTGSQPWSLTYSDGTTSTPVTGIAASPYTFGTGSLAANATYSLTALSDATGCAATTLPAATTITVNPRPAFTTTSANVTCNGAANGSIAVTATGGTGSYEYSINNGGAYQASGTFAGLAPATYAVLVRNLGGTQCAATASQSVTISQPAALLASATATNATCANGADGSISASATGGTLAYQFNLNGGSYQASGNFGGLAPGSYAIGVKDANNCTATATATVGSANPAPTATLAATTPVCSGSAPTLTGTLTGTGPWSITYTANGGPATTVTGLTSPFSIVPAAITAGTTYAITALSDDNGCSATGFPAAATVAVTPLPAATLANSGPVCAGNAASVTLTFTAGAAPYAFSYSDGTTTTPVTTSANPFVIATPVLTGNVTYTVTGLSSAGCASATPSYATTIAVNTATEWTGAASADWFDAGNWTACVPTALTDATVPNGLATYPVLATTATSVARNLNIGTTGTGAPASLTVSAAAVLDLRGNLATASAASLVATAGTVRFAAAAPQAIGAGSFFDLALAGTGANLKTLAGDVTVANGLDLTGGLLALGSNKATLTGTATVTGFSPTNFVVVNGTGTLCYATVGVGGTATRSTVFFPIGSTTASYTPSTLTNTGTSDTFCGAVQDAVTNVPAGNAGSAGYVRKQWDFTEAVTGGSTAALTLQWNAADEAAGFNRNLVDVVHYTGGAWQPTGFASYSAANVVAGPAYTLTRSGYTSFSPFAVQDGSKPLPVSLTRFAATRKAADAVLDWATAQEKDNAGFGIEVSLDGKAFRQLHFVEPASASSAAPRTYTYTDREAGKAGLRYYRLAQHDLNGTTNHSAVQAVLFEGPAESGLTASPNPFGGELTLAVTSAKLLENAALTLTDALGRTVLTRTLTLPAGQSQATLRGLDALPVGVYTLHLAGNGRAQHLKVTKE